MKRTIGKMQSVMGHWAGNVNAGNTKMRKNKSHNIQIRGIINMAAQAEPELFGQTNAVLMPVKENTPSGNAKLIAARMLQCAEWHAEQQIEFWNDFFEEKVSA